MQRLASSLVKLPVFAIHSGTELGNVTGFVVASEKLKVILLSVDTTESKSPHYLLPTDIRFFDHKKIIIDSHQGLAEAEDLVRFKDVLTKPFRLFGAKIVTTSGKKLGNVKDFSFETEGFFVAKLYINSRYWQRLFYDSHIIDQTDVVDVKDDHTIVVRDNAIKSQARVFNFLPAKS